MKIYFNACNKYRKSEKTKILYIFKKTLNISIVYSKCRHEYEKYLKKNNQFNIKNSWFN